MFSEIEKLKRAYSLFVLIALNLIPIIVYFVLHGWWREITNWVRVNLPESFQRGLAMLLFSYTVLASATGRHT